MKEITRYYHTSITLCADEYDGPTNITRVAFQSLLLPSKHY